MEFRGTEAGMYQIIKSERGRAGGTTVADCGGEGRYPFTATMQKTTRFLAMNSANTPDLHFRESENDPLPESFAVTDVFCPESTILAHNLLPSPQKRKLG